MQAAKKKKPVTSTRKRDPLTSSLLAGFTPCLIELKSKRAKVLRLLFKKEKNNGASLLVRCSVLFEEKKHPLFRAFSRKQKQKICQVDLFSSSHNSHSPRQRDWLAGCLLQSHPSFSAPFFFLFIPKHQAARPRQLFCSVQGLTPQFARRRCCWKGKNTTNLAAPLLEPLKPANPRPSKTPLHASQNTCVTRSFFFVAGLNSICGRRLPISSAQSQAVSAVSIK